MATAPVDDARANATAALLQLVLVDGDLFRLEGKHEDALLAGGEEFAAIVESVPVDAARVRAALQLLKRAPDAAAASASGSVAASMFVKAFEGLMACGWSADLAESLADDGSAAVAAAAEVVGMLAFGSQRALKHAASDSACLRAMLRCVENREAGAGDWAERLLYVSFEFLVYGIAHALCGEQWASKERDDVRIVRNATPIIAEAWREHVDANKSRMETECGGGEVELNATVGALFCALVAALAESDPRRAEEALADEHHRDVVAGLQAAPADRPTELVPRLMLGLTLLSNSPMGPKAVAGDVAAAARDAVARFRDAPPTSETALIAERLLSTLDAPGARAPLTTLLAHTSVDVSVGSPDPVRRPSGAAAAVSRESPRRLSAASATSHEPSGDEGSEGLEDDAVIKSRLADLARWSTDGEEGRSAAAAAVAAPADAPSAEADASAAAAAEAEETSSLSPEVAAEPEAEAVEAPQVREPTAASSALPDSPVTEAAAEDTAESAPQSPATTPSEPEAEAVAAEPETEVVAAEPETETDTVEPDAEAAALESETEAAVAEPEAEAVAAPAEVAPAVDDAADASAAAEIDAEAVEPAVAETQEVLAPDAPASAVPVDDPLASVSAAAAEAAPAPEAASTAAETSTPSEPSAVASAVPPSVRSAGGAGGAARARSGSAAVVGKFGTIIKRGSGFPRSWKTRHMRLSSRGMDYFVKEGGALKGTVPLTRSTRAVMLPSTKRNGIKCFEVAGDKGDKGLLARGESDADSEAWVAAINAAVDAKFGTA